MSILEDASVRSGALDMGEGGYSFTNLADTVSQAVVTGAGMLHAIVINTAAAGIVTIYNNTEGTGTKIATLKSGLTENTYIYDIKFSTGLYVIPAAAVNITYIYRTGA